MVQLKLKEQHYITLFIGPSGSGKSCAIKHWAAIMKAQKRFDYAVVITGTRENDYFQGWIPDQYVHGPDHIQETVEKVRNLQRKFKKEKRNINCLLILDDLQQHGYLKSK